MQEGMYVCAWDRGQDGTPEVAIRLYLARLGRESLRTAYYASKFIRLHAPCGRIWFPQDGTVYIHSGPALYGHPRPQADSTVAELNSVLTVADDTTDSEAVAYTVPLHNLRLPDLHRDLVAQTPLGDAS